jgi:hypothetical protein
LIKLFLEYTRYAAGGRSRESQTEGRGDLRERDTEGERPRETEVEGYRGRERPRETEGEDRWK